MGRTKLYHERMVAALAKGTFKRIGKVLQKDEDRTEFVREAIEALIHFRESGGIYATLIKRLREGEGVKPADA